MAKIKAVGIDLGTTNSAVAWVNGSGRTEMVHNAEGDILTPSVVLFEDTEVVVGKEARNAAVAKSDRVAQWVKREMGAAVCSRPIRGEYLPPEVIQACILRKLKSDAVRSLGPELAVVITVPAYFDEPRRKATADAGEMAGLDVLDIVNEPTAAALGFSELTGYLGGPAGPPKPMHVMVYDLGGGTFDATILRLASGDIRTLATDGDVQLGGHDWDLRLIHYVSDAFEQLYGLNPRAEQAGFNRLHRAIVEAKHTLSARQKATLRVDYQGCAGEIVITREQFEEITADLLERTAYTSRQLLGAARLEWSDVSRVLLVGGSTRMPMVPRMLQQLTGVDPDRTVNPDEAVARGAALYASHLLHLREQGDSPPKFQVVNVNSHSLGIEGIDAGTLRKTNVVLIPRNTPLPARFKETFVTKSDHQQSIVIQVLEGESSLPSDCTAIGRTVIRDLPPGLPKGWPVEVTFEYAANGRLEVRGVVPGTDRETRLEIERDSGLSRDGVVGWKEAVVSQAGFASFASRSDDALKTQGQASQAAPVPNPAVQPKAPSAMQAVGTAPDQPGIQHSPIPSRDAWGSGYTYAGSQAATTQHSPAAQAPRDAAAGSLNGDMGGPGAYSAGASALATSAIPSSAGQPPPLPASPASSLAGAADLGPEGLPLPATDGPPHADDPNALRGWSRLLFIGYWVIAILSRKRTRSSRRGIKLLVNITGYVVFSILGLFAGYLFLRYVYPKVELPWLW